jgi:hypothetical protein
MIDESSKLDDPMEDPIDEFEHVLRKFDGGIGTLKGSILGEGLLYRGGCCNSNDDMDSSSTADSSVSTSPNLSESSPDLSTTGLALHKEPADVADEFVPKADDLV